MEKHVSGNLKPVTVFDEDQDAVLPPEGSVVAVTVTSILSPHHFYVNLPWGPHSIQAVTANSPEVETFLAKETLESLNDAMEAFYKRKRLDTDYSLYAPEEAVAAKCRQTSAWLRAKVIDVKEEDEKVCVMFIDFGNTEWVHEADIRQLDKRFLLLPPQAIECGLAGVRPLAPHTSWPKESITEFFNLVETKTLSAHVKQRFWSGRLVLRLYDNSGESNEVDISKALVENEFASPEEDVAPPLSHNQGRSPGRKVADFYFPA